ncbi:MAG: class I SAM-dependent methyltransferase [Bradymonadales bacterium]|jgi:23S rRNA (cytosine1962-C5)-methyltransferase
MTNKTHHRTTANAQQYYRIIHDGDDYLVVDKACGINTHAAFDGDIALYELLCEEQGVKLGLHQRLDKETSGILLFSKNKAAAQILAKAFESRDCVRRYVAIVCGIPPQKQGTLQNKLVHKNNVSFEATDGKLAKSRYKLLQSAGPFSWLELELVTGFTHQLRVQCALAGFPILGDALYGGGELSSRLYLHSESLRFSAKGRELIFEAPAERIWGKLDIVQIFNDILQNIQTNIRQKAYTPEEALRLFTPQQSGIAEIVLERVGSHLLFRHIEQAGESLWCKDSLELFMNMSKDVLNCVDYTYIVHPHPKSRGKNTRFSSFERISPEPFYATEHGCRFYFDFSQGPATGLYLDQRENRLWVKENARGRILNLFAYTCAFSVMAASAGRDCVCTSVDVSKRALEMGRMNFQANDISPNQHYFYDDDVLKYLRRAVNAGQNFDGIICDPPSFGRAQKSTFRLENELEGLMQSCLSLLARGGFLLFSVNKREVRLKRLSNSARRSAKNLGITLDFVLCEVSEPALGPLGVGTELKTLIVRRT